MTPSEKKLVARIEALEAQIAEIEAACVHCRAAKEARALRAAAHERGLADARRDAAARKHVLDEFKRDPVVAVVAPPDNAGAIRALRRSNIGLRSYMRRSEFDAIKRAHPDEMAEVLSAGVGAIEVNPATDWHTVEAIVNTTPPLEQVKHADVTSRASRVWEAASILDNT